MTRNPTEMPFAFLSLDVPEGEIPAVPLFLSDFNKDENRYINQLEIRFKPFQTATTVKSIRLHKDDLKGRYSRRLRVSPVFWKRYDPGEWASLPPGSFVLTLNDPEEKERILTPCPR